MKFVPDENRTLHFNDARRPLGHYSKMSFTPKINVEVGKVSVEWLAEEKTQVVGTFPLRKKGWTGYTEKDTAGQTNIYSVELFGLQSASMNIQQLMVQILLTVLAKNLTLIIFCSPWYMWQKALSAQELQVLLPMVQRTPSAIAAFLGLFIVAGASSILLQVGENAPQMQTTVYSGPSLSYYVNKFKPTETIEVSAPSPSESSSTTESSQSDTSSATESQTSTTEVPPVPVESRAELESSVSNEENVS
uniref:Uncharacterized protein n=1 Tax=Chenopodium quinoa TaxID=63459 RepID=A0A803MLB0_CHEQI